MIYPECLKKGDTIGITATSGGAKNEIDIKKIEMAKNNLCRLGYDVIETDNVRKNNKLVSSSSIQRAKEFFELYCNEKVKHIIAAHGGEFLMDMLPYLEKYDLKDINAKWIQGFSDTSLLLFYITTKYNVATVHSTNLGGYGRNSIIDVYEKTLDYISSTDEVVQNSFDKFESIPINWQEGKEFELPNLDTKVQYKDLYNFKEVNMKGRLIGGCIDTIKNIIGTPYDYTVNFCSQYKEGMLWYLENCEMNVCDLYRALWQMKEAGWFSNSNGFLIGRTVSKQTIHDFSYEDALHSAFDDLKLPVIYDVDIGHTQLQWTMINGSYAEFEYAEGKGQLLIKFI